MSRATRHGRKPNGSGCVREKRLTTGEARYVANVGPKYLGSHVTRLEAEEAVRRWLAKDTTVERTVEG